MSKSNNFYLMNNHRLPSKIRMADGLYKAVVLNNDWHALVEGKNVVHLVHTPCYYELRENWPKINWHSGGRVNKKSVSCYYCKTKEKLDVRDMLKFLFGC